MLTYSALTVTLKGLVPMHELRQTVCCRLQTGRPDSLAGRMVSVERRDGDSKEVPAEDADGFSMFARKRKRSTKALAEAAAPSHTQDAGATPAQPCEERPAEGVLAAGEAEDDGTTFKDLGVSTWLCRCALSATK